jgi:hypothetical protein
MQQMVAILLFQELHPLAVVQVILPQIQAERHL